uniref:Cyclin-dependent kinase 14-like isoform X2 n=1 Tax=Petromyzon marinus TaxID=7757 RepID=A0AAJ7WLR9_PETMA|nr:cyclin-dependent kinase 14-like isoform X2 [Petromyzon marinus]
MEKIKRNITSRLSRINLKREPQACEELWESKTLPRRGPRGGAGARPGPQEGDPAALRHHSVAVPRASGPSSCLDPLLLLHDCEPSTSKALEHVAGVNTSSNAQHPHVGPPPPRKFGGEALYVRLQKIGQGSYATVFKGISRVTWQFVALKVVYIHEEEGAPFNTIREVSLLKTLKHANIVLLHDIVYTQHALTLVFEYLETDLHQYMERHPGGLNAHNVKLFLLQLLRGLAYTHSRGILHRDVKPHNLLLGVSGELKLADFGMARAQSVPSRSYSSEVATLWYRPPDVLLGSTRYSSGLDMWAVGCIFVEMLQGMVIFPGVPGVWDQLERVWQVLGTPNEEEWPEVTSLPLYKPGIVPKNPRQLGRVWRMLGCDPHAEDLARSLLQCCPSRRLPAHAALRHSYFSDLPPRVRALPDALSVFSVESVALLPEGTAHPSAHCNPDSSWKPSKWRR